MTTGTETDTRALRALVAVPGPVLSVYFDLDPRPGMGLDAEGRWQGLCHDLAAD
ncbi:hypothetical protein ACIRYZ_40725 [Kitasatospora sp. NPDC101155]|uniref:hypothetical protein n=1 Tax=Kitasatospora sp. NPDC101155 TaxID=3364097 RepID=UPI0038194FE0